MSPARQKNNRVENWSVLYVQFLLTLDSHFTRKGNEKVCASVQETSD